MVNIILLYCYIPYITIQAIYFDIIILIKLKRNHIINSQGRDYVFKSVVN